MSSHKKTSRIFSILPIFIPLILLLSAAAPGYFAYENDYYKNHYREIVPSDSYNHEIIPDNIIPIAPENNKGNVDTQPSLTFSSNTENTETTAILRARASDFNHNAGILWIRIYENGNLLGEKKCDGHTPCIFVKTKIEENPASHSYYAQTKDIGNNVVTSETIFIEFEGLNHPPQIDSFAPEDTNLESNVGETIHFEIQASDNDNDALNYEWTLNNNLVSSSSSYEFRATINDIGTNTVAVRVSDNEYETAQSWSITVSKIETNCSLTFSQESPINYAQQPFTALCSCTNPEADIELLRNGQDAGNENNQPVTLPANPSGYDYVCSVAETEHYESASVSENYVVEKGRAILTLTNTQNWNSVYGEETLVSCNANNNEIEFNLYRNSVLASNPDINVLSAGVYDYVCEAIENENWTGAFAGNTLEISKADSSVNLLLNGIDDNIIVYTNEQVEINGLLLIPTDTKNDGSDDAIPGDDQKILMQKQERAKQSTYHIDILLDGRRVAYGDHTANYATAFDAPGTYNATVIYTETENYSSSLETHFITVLSDDESPVITLTYPQDNAVINSQDIAIIYSVADNVDNLLDCNVWSDTNGTWQIDGSQQTVNGIGNLWNYTNLQNGVYTWNIECADDSGNTAFAQANRTFTIAFDNEAPIIEFVQPTPSDNAFVNNNYVFVNTTITDNIGIDSVIIEWQGANETMVGVEPNYHINKTDLADDIYTYKVWANDLSGNMAVSETRQVTIYTGAAIHDISVNSIELSKEVNSVNKSLDDSTAYLNDLIYVTAEVSNLGTQDETSINISLQNNVGMIESKIIRLNVSQTKQITFVWNSAPEGWHTLRVRAEPVAGETNIINNEKSYDIMVWSVCDVVDCSIFGPRTAQESYQLEQPFLVRSITQNLWNNETFKDVRVELEVEPGLEILPTWSSIQYADLDLGQFKIINWELTSHTRTSLEIKACLGNNEYCEIKQIMII